MVIAVMNTEVRQCRWDVWSSSCYDNW